MDAHSDWPDWGRLIDDARDRLRPEVSQNEAARQLGMSGTNWRRIVQGVSGTMASPRGMKTVARMARVVGVTPEDLEEVGRPDVAEELRKQLEDVAEQLRELLPSEATLLAEIEQLQARSDALHESLISHERRADEALDSRTRAVYTRAAANADSRLVAVQAQEEALRAELHELRKAAIGSPSDRSAAFKRPSHEPPDERSEMSPEEQVRHARELLAESARLMERSRKLQEEADRYLSGQGQRGASPGEENDRHDAG